MFAFMFMGTVPVNADTTITNLIIESGEYYTTFDGYPDWVVVRNANGVLVWINDTTEYSLVEVQDITEHMNPALANGVTHWAIITGYGVFSNDKESDFILPSRFCTGSWGSYWFTESYETGQPTKLDVEVHGVSYMSYSYTTPQVQPVVANSSLLSFENYLTIWGLILICGYIIYSCIKAYLKYQ
jgi:hypothetical protein